jgi:hypothetical protein
MKHKPNFFVIGAVKAGTTSLYHYLSQHPQVYLSPIKEPHYFSTDIDSADFSSTYIQNTFTDLEGYFKKKELSQIQLAFVKKLEHYEQLFSNVKNEKSIGEFSTSYLFSTQAAKNIYQYNPHAKIVAVLRNPISRAFSHYLMAFRDSFTTKNFMDSVQEDMKRTRKGWGISELFIELGMYASQIKIYQDILPAEQIKIVLHDDLINKPNDLLDDFCKFLEIEPYEFKMEEKYNVAAIPKHKQFMSVMTKLGLKKNMGAMMPNLLKKHVKKFVFTSDKIPQITQEEKLFLLDIYKEDITKTSKLIGRDLSAWLEV